MLQGVLPCGEGSKEVSGTAGLSVSWCLTGADHESAVCSFVTHVQENIHTDLRTVQHSADEHSRLLSSIYTTAILPLI